MTFQQRRKPFKGSRRAPVNSRSGRFGECISTMSEIYRELISIRKFRGPFKIIIKEVISKFQIVFVFVSSYEPGEQELGIHLGKHGDGVKDVAFSVENLNGIVKVSYLIHREKTFEANKIRTLLRLIA